MKHIFSIILLLSALPGAAQRNFNVELYAGSGIIRLHRFTPYSFDNGNLVINSQMPQGGLNFGAMFSRKAKVMTLLYSIGICRNIAYTTLKHDVYSFAFNSQTTYTRNVHYLRWDMTRAELGIQLQAALGKERNIRLTGGLLFTSVLINRTRANYWYVEQEQYYDNTTGTYIYTHFTELRVERIPARQMGMAFAGGLILPIPETRVSIAANWRFGFTPNNSLFILAERGMNISMVFTL
ncbi:MAG: hypothetical protein MUC87_08230 [Bacteroidia bacterium]|jgi:hypothetical protein|nr:hypothetical protein [Bacteroidia bacterium]